MPPPIQLGPQQPAPQGPQEIGRMLALAARIFGDGDTAAAGMNSLIPPLMPGTPQQLRGTAPRAPWPSGQTFSGLGRPDARMLG